MYEEEISLRLSQLRQNKGVSAREMSLSIGQNENYINSIENGNSLPSMSAFFFICEYLQITPSEFFDLSNSNPEKLRVLINDLKRLDDQQLESIATIVKGLANGKF
ncbi:MAG: helix-turn-helix transcriptional regulator [Clostridia bacterium]|nr:helix-turn-helix transcriptional regulator [Clostridia bacterium]